MIKFKEQEEKMFLTYHFALPRTRACISVKDVRVQLTFLTFFFFCSQIIIDLFIYFELISLL